MNTVTWGSLHGPLVAKYRREGECLEQATRLADVAALGKARELAEHGKRVTGIPAHVRNLTAADMTAIITAPTDKDMFHG